ncbi:MAG: type VI secretion system tip protein VgrG [Myxococcales bacterium]|nr:type VI secretion system tip protein VgrG [Myxococcales bacterium]
MTTNFTQQNVSLTLQTPLAENELLLRSLHGEDRISGLFHYQLELVSEKADVDMAAIVGQPMTACVAHDSGKYAFNGIVSRFVQAGTNKRFTTYYAELRPWLWMLTLVTDSQIYQEMSVLDIIEKVFGDHGFSDYSIKAQGSYNPREYCVQFQETCFDFVSRLMEDEGLFYFFEHEEGKHTLVIADDASAHQPREDQGPGRVKTQDSTSPGEDIITHLALEQQVTVGGYAMTDYNFERPATDLGVNVAGEAAEREIFEYPGGFGVKGDGESRVKVRIEAQELPAKLVRGQSHCRGFLSGYKMEVEEHLRDDLNGEYVLRWVSHQVSKNRYSNTFEAFPADVPFRPQQLTRKPMMVGAQTAVVVGKSGEEIFTDKYGRIKVQFFWDRYGKKDDKASCWIRVAQGWAGKGWGAWYLPRIGQEVVVSFLDGDIDRPLVTGSVYNAEQTVPYSLPGDATKSTLKSESSKGGGGNNEIRFEDKKDSEEIYIHAQKDMNTVIENDMTRKVLNTETITVKSDRTRIVEEGNETLTIEKGNRDVKVAKGNETYHVEGTRDVSVKGDETHTNDGNFTHEVKGNYVLKVKGDITIEASGKISMKSGAAFAMKAGSSMKAEAAQAVQVKGGTDVKIEGGVGFSAKGGAKAEVKSPMTTVAGDGMLTLKGGMVKIN